MTPKQTAFVRRAERALATAHVTLDAGDAEAAVNRAYYACFYLAQAALLGVGEEPKTHKGTHSRFGLHFVANGPMSTADGRILTDAATTRERSDYDAFAVTDTAAAADLIADVERFVAAVRALL